MAWRKLEDTFYDAPKLSRLARHLSISRAQAAGHIALLWSWSLRHAPDGDLSKYDDEDIEDAVSWEGTRGGFLNACATTRFVDRSSDGRVMIHNWLERGGTYAESKRKQRLRASKKECPDLSRDVPGHSETVPECPALEEKRIEEKRIDTCQVDLVTDPKNVKQADHASTSPADAADLNPTVARDDIDEVWQHYRKHHPRAVGVLKPNRKEYRLIKQRLRDYSADDLKAAIDGFHRDPFYCGQNDRQTKYLGINTLLRDASQVQKGLELVDRSNGRWRRARLDEPDDAGDKAATERARQHEIN